MSVPVSDPTSSPWSTIVLVESTFPSGASFAGSGVMVSPNDVLTASHVLYMPDQGGAATSVHVLPAGISAPFGDIMSNSFHYYTNFDPTGSGLLMPGNGGPGLAGSELDLALVDLPTAIGNQTGWMQLDPNFTGGTVNITGLPAASGWMESNDVVSASKSPTDSIISYSAALNPGDSGAPIWYQASDGAHVAGVVSTTSWGGAVDGVYSDLMNWINADSGSVVATQPAAPAPAVTTVDTTTTPTTTVDTTASTTTTVDTTASSTTTVPTASSGDQVAANLSDFDANGNSDIVLHNTTTGATEIDTVDGTAPTGSTDTSAYAPPVWTLSGTGDFNGDGHGDMLWQAANGQVAIWTQNGATSIDTSIVGQGPANAHVAGTGDFYGDGHSDVLWQGSDSTVSTWQMNDHTIVGGGTIGQQTNDWHIAGTGDFNGDGKSDIVWHNDNGSVAMWMMNGTGYTSTGTISAPSTDWHIAGVGDFNADHNNDIVWQNTNGAMSIWLMNGGNIAGGWGTITGTVPAGTTLAGVGDFNHDRHADLLWHDAGGALRAELMGADGLHPIGSGTVASIGSDWVVS